MYMKFEPRELVNFLQEALVLKWILLFIGNSKYVKSSVQFQHLFCQFVMPKFVYFLFRLDNGADT
jgi:hypothetical protein